MRCNEFPCIVQKLNLPIVIEGLSCTILHTGPWYFPSRQSEIIGSGWETVLQGDAGPDQSDVVRDIQLDADHLPLATNENGDHVFRFYWIDAYEDMYNQPGKTCSSIILIVIYLLFISDIHQVAIYIKYTLHWR